jgi:NADPH:quinone reductase-like Zn-dependent oxidoreductase
MKASVYRNYGSPDVLGCEEVAKPSPGDDEVLIKVHAAAANPLDYQLMSGAYIMRRPLPYLVKLLVSSRFVSQRVVFFVAAIGMEDLTVLKELIEAGKMTPVIDRHYTLSDAADAIRYLKEGDARGKVIIVFPHGHRERRRRDALADSHRS